MGKQINFYMDSEVQDRFIDHLLGCGFALLNDMAVAVDAKESNIYFAYLYKESYGNLIFRQNYRAQIDQIKSPVIEFSKTRINRAQRKILRGRIWLSTQFYTSDGTLVKREAELLMDYEKLVRWIKKNVPYQKIPKGNFEVMEYANDSLFELCKDGFIYTM